MLPTHLYESSARFSCVWKATLSWDGVERCCVLVVKHVHLGNGGDWSLLFSFKAFSQNLCVCILSSQWAARGWKGVGAFLFFAFFSFFSFFSSYFFKQAQWLIPFQLTALPQSWYHSSFNLDAVAWSDERSCNTFIKTRAEMEIWLIYSCDSRRTDLSRSRVPDVIRSYSHRLFPVAGQADLFWYSMMLMITEDPCLWKIRSKQQNFGM